MEGKTVLINKLPQDLYQKLRKLAFKNELSVSKQLIEIVKSYFLDK